MIQWKILSWKCTLDVSDEVSQHKIDKDIVYFGRHLNGHSRHYRQTIMLSTFADAGWNSGTCLHWIRFEIVFANFFLHNTIWIYLRNYILSISSDSSTPQIFCMAVSRHLNPLRSRMPMLGLEVSYREV